MRSTLTIAMVLMTYLHSFAQPYLVRDLSIAASEGNNGLSMAWAGGLNNPQFSNIDLNANGTLDLFVFDRSGDVSLTFRQFGQEGQMNWKFRPQYQNHFPRLIHWALLRDFNCDGDLDIYTASQFGPGVMVFENEGMDEFDWFSIKDSLLEASYEFSSTSGETNVYVGVIDIPAIHDVDNDGDLDIFTFQLLGSKIEFYKNFSIENDGVCDIDYQLKNRCWGYIQEDDNSPEILLGQNCTNVVDPHSPVMHSGSTLLMLDKNNDGFKDIVLGDLNFSSFNTIINGGPGILGPDSVTSVDYNFPNTNEPFILNNFPASFYVDINNDGVKDFVAAPNAQNTADNKDAVYLFLNEGSDDSPDLELESSNFLQGEMIDVGEGAHPIIVDVNQDGLMDIIIANRKLIQDSITTSSLHYLENTGSEGDPSFNYMDSDLFSLSTAGIGEAFYPSFIDMDGDNALDMIVGNLNGELYYFINSANAGQPMNFPGPAQVLMDDQNEVIDLGQFSKPQIFDLNNDNLPDLIIGNRVGRIAYYENTGSSSNPEFTWVTDTLGGILTPGYLINTGYSSPHFYREDDETKLITGSETGKLDHYENIDGNLGGIFTLIDGPASNIYEGKRTSVAAMDWNNDGLNDLIVGNYRGGLSFFRGDINSDISESKDFQEEFLIFPNPAKDVLQIQTQNSELYDLQIFNSMGQLIYRASKLHSDQRISINEWPNGHYYIKLIQQNRIENKTLIITH